MEKILYFFTLQYFWIFSDSLYVAWATLCCARCVAAPVKSRMKHEDLEMDVTHAAFKLSELHRNRLLLTLSQRHWLRAIQFVPGCKQSLLLLFS